MLGSREIFYHNVYACPVLFFFPRFLIADVHGGCTAPGVTLWRCSYAEKPEEGGLGSTSLVMHFWVDHSLLTWQYLSEKRKRAEEKTDYICMCMYIYSRLMMSVYNGQSHKGVDCTHWNCMGLQVFQSFCREQACNLIKALLSIFLSSQLGVL